MHKTERSALVAQQAQLGRLEATKAALIPIKKSPAWWELAQDERRAIFEERSQHMSIGVKYVARIARRLCWLSELAFGRHTWCADVREHTTIVWDVEQFAGQHITLTNREETKGTYSQQGPNGRRNPVEPMAIPEPGDQGRAKASCWIEAGTGDGRFQPHHYPDQNPDHQRRPG